MRGFNSRPITLVIILCSRVCVCVSENGQYTVIPYTHMSWETLAKACEAIVTPAHWVGLAAMAAAFVNAPLPSGPACWHDYDKGVYPPRHPVCGDGDSYSEGVPDSKVAFPIGWGVVHHPLLELFIEHPTCRVRMHSAPVSQGGVRPADFDSGSGLGMQQSSCDYLIRQPCLAFFLTARSWRSWRRNRWRGRMRTLQHALTASYVFWLITYIYIYIIFVSP